MNAAEGASGAEPDAITRLERAVAESERTRGPEDPGTLTLRNNLAAAYNADGRVEEAIPLFERTLAGRERILGPDQLDTLTSCSNLAINYDAAGRFSEAIPLFERSLAGFERILGPDHARTVTTRSNLAAACTAVRRFDKAIPLHERCLADLERMLGPDDPGTLIARNNLAVDYNAAGRIDEAIPLYERSLADFERTLGPDNPDTLIARDNLQAAYKEAGRPRTKPAEALRAQSADTSRAELADEPGRDRPRGSQPGASRWRGKRRHESTFTAQRDAQRKAVAAARKAGSLDFADASLALADLLMSNDGYADEAISALRDALTVYRADEQPWPWFRCQWYLGRLLAGRAVSCDDLLAASAHLDAAATTLKPPAVDAAPYAQVCGELSVVLADGRCPVDWERLDRALSWNEECLKYWPPDDPGYRADHAEALARSYLIRAETSHEDADRSRAVALFDQAAQWARESGAAAERVIDLEIYAAEVLAKLQTDRQQNLELAIERLTSLRDQAGSQTPAASRAAVLQSLGTVYQDRIADDPAANMEQAIGNLEAALAIWDVDTNPDEWASAANNLANAYCRRIRGNNSENLEQAIGYAEAASVIRTRAKDPQLWARTLHSLASMYFQRPFGHKDENIEKSIALSQVALEVETRDAYPARWAGAQHNLGSAYLQRVKGDRSDNLRTAVSLFRDALSVRSRLGDLSALGQSLLGLGQALDALATETGDEQALADASSAYQQAVAAFEDVGAADHAASAYYSLAVALSRQPGPDSAARALEAARQCLPAWDTEHNPFRARLVYALLAQLTDRVGGTAEAYGWICRAIEASESLYAGAAVADSKAEQDEEGGDWYEVAADLALRSGAAASDALIFAERARARILGESLVRIQQDWSIPAELLASEAALEAERDRAWAGIRAVHPAAAVIDGGFAQIWELAGRLTELREQLRCFPGGPEYVAARTGLVSWEQIRRWADVQPAGFALLEYLVLADRVVAFVIRQDRPEPAVVDIPLDRQALGRCANAVFREMDGSITGHVRRETWDQIAAPLVSLVRPELDGVRLLCIVPHLLLYQLPLHALGGPGATLLDQAAVYYAPSARLAMQLSQRGRQTDRSRALVVGDTNGDLPCARQEARQIGQILGVRPLIGDEATLDAVWPQLPGADLIHFACHGYLRLWDPGLSAIRLASDDLTARDIRRAGLSCELLVLSGCDTGYELGLREPLGLLSALLAAGARRAIGSLWPVDDESTKELFIRFFSELTSSCTKNGSDEIARSVAGCLRVAELALRETRPERYYWAPFIAIGSW